MSDWSVELVGFRRYLKRRNFASNTVRCYLNDLFLFQQSIKQPLAEVRGREIEQFIEQQQGAGMSASTINRRLSVIRELYCYLRQSENPELVVPVSPKFHRLKQADPLPRAVKSEELELLFGQITDVRDRAIFTLMLRCGLRVAEVAALALEDLDLARQQLLIREPKNGRDRIVYLAADAWLVLKDYLKQRPKSEAKQVFLVPRGRGQGKGISVRGIQKRLEHYASEAGLELSCHGLRHTFASQLLEQGAEIVTIQALLGHAQVTTTQRYARVSNPKVREDYFRGMAKVLNQLPSPQNLEAYQLLS